MLCLVLAIIKLHEQFLSLLWKVLNFLFLELVSVSECVGKQVELAHLKHFEAQLRKENQWAEIIKINRRGEENQQ